MKSAIQVKAPAMTFALFDCRKMPGCSTSWGMLLASTGPVTWAMEELSTEADSLAAMVGC